MCLYNCCFSGLFRYVLFFWLHTVNDFCSILMLTRITCRLTVFLVVLEIHYWCTSSITALHNWNVSVLQVLRQFLAYASYAPCLLPSPSWSIIPLLFLFLGLAPRYIYRLPFLSRFPRLLALPVKLHSSAVLKVGLF